MRAVPAGFVFAVGVAGIAIFSCMDAVMKGLVLAIGVYPSLLWRSVASTAISGALYGAMRPRRPTRVAMGVHLLRGGISTVMTVSFFWGLARVPMAQAVALTFIAPLLSLFLAALLLGERIGRGTVVASVIAAAGVALILGGQWWSAPRGPAAGTAVLGGSGAVLVSALCYAVNIVLMRRQALVAGPVEVAFSQSAIVTVLLALGWPLFGAWPNGAHAPTIVLAAALAVVSLLLLAWAYARGEASYLSPGEYTAFVWAALLGWMVFGERVAPATLAGAALIIAGCVAASRQRPAAPAVEMGV